MKKISFLLFFAIASSSAAHTATNQEGSVGTETMPATKESTANLVGTGTINAAIPGLIAGNPLPANPNAQLLAVLANPTPELLAARALYQQNRRAQGINNPTQSQTTSRSWYCAIQ